MPKKKPLEGKPEVHKDLDGFEMNINEFLQIARQYLFDMMPATQPALVRVPVTQKRWWPLPTTCRSAKA